MGKAAVQEPGSLESTIQKQMPGDTGKPSGVSAQHLVLKEGKWAWLLSTNLRGHRGNSQIPISSGQNSTTAPLQPGLARNTHFAYKGQPHQICPYQTIRTRLEIAPNCHTTGKY